MPGTIKTFVQKFLQALTSKKQSNMFMF